MSEKKQRKTRTSRYDSDRDARLRRTYGITEKEADTVIANQEGGCRICGRVPKSNNLHVDHDHKIEKWKVVSEKRNGLWYARPKDSETRDIQDRYPRLVFEESARTKSEATRKVKARLKRISVRGMVDWGCNSAIKAVRDDPAIAEGIARYLWRYYQFLEGLQQERNGFKE